MLLRWGTQHGKLLLLGLLLLRRRRPWILIIETVTVGVRNGLLLHLDGGHLDKAEFPGDFGEEPGFVGVFSGILHAHVQVDGMIRAQNVNRG